VIIYTILCVKVYHLICVKLMLISKKNLKLILIGIVLVTCPVLSFCLKAHSENISPISSKQLQNIKNNPAYYSKEVKKGISASKKDDEEMVTVNVVNFGRKNPFKPYKKYSVMTGDLRRPGDIPAPPKLNPTADAELKNLMESKVSGILYDPSGKSVAIINVKGSDYMVRKTDSIYGFYIENITKSKIILKYGNNRYSVSVGEVIGQDAIIYDPVVRQNQEFGEAGYKLPTINTTGL